ncbi:MAG: hypothetical protein IH612_09285 [Desulfofustis sp.]|nr:hypothetical protein [Desulfofustis sp.]
MNIKQWIVSCLTLIAATTALVACQPSISPYADNYFDPQLTIPLVVGTPQEGTWQTFDLAIDYRYHATGTIEVSGTAALGRHYQDLYERLNKLDLYLFLLDDASKVLESKKIGQALATDTDTVVTFSETLSLPPGASHLAFGYEGRVQASDTERGSGGDWFYKLPLARRP